MGFSSSIHLPTNFMSSLLFTDEYYCIVFMCHIFIIHFSVEGHLGCFHPLDVARASMSMTEQVFVEYDAKSFRHKSQSDIVRSYGWFIFGFWRILHTDSQSGCTRLQSYQCE